ncbi:MAG: DUF4349 domain-containing protein [Thermosynechococcaceae cyanobacterium MS004]|nr:DUF4349 domain-containing protein [Thermosynechococcaceae cyanobacterium MS004]
MNGRLSQDQETALGINLPRRQAALGHSARERSLLASTMLLSMMLSSIVFGSCSAATRSGLESSAPASAPNAAPEIQAEEQNAGSAGTQNLVADSTVAPKPARAQLTQLIKTATLALTVQSVEPAIQGATKVVQARGGDILNLQDSTPQSDASYHTASLQFRVPQAQLDTALEELATLGTVDSRSIQAEDVAGQLVDFGARLKNLRKAEGVVLGIMERSGSVGDVLKVSQELTRIRNEIEQIQGQVQHLQQRVAYSTLNLTLKSAIAQTQQGISVGDRIKETWLQSTHAVGKTTVNLLQVGIWLLVFSPYLAGGAAIIVLGRKALLRPSVVAPPNSPES